MKKKQKVNSERDKELFTKVYHQYKTKDASGGEKIENHEKHIPKHLADNPQFLRRMNMFKAEELDGSIENFEKNKKEFKGFLSGIKDIKFLEGLSSQFPEVFKKELITERISELNKPKSEEKTKKEETVKPE